MLALPRSNRSRSAGFTLIELMITLIIFALVAVTVTLVLQNSAKSKQRTSSRIETEQGARAALDLMARDIRTAGYGADRDATPPQPAITYVDSMEIILSQNQRPFPELTPLGPSAPLAYSPTSNPKPFPLVGTAYTPAMRYRTGAELIRYTLDVNNDGAVDGTDISAPQGADAAATMNPNDYVLVREVFGDSTNNVAGDNGGTQERVALIRRPGTGVPVLFTVYMRGLNTPWDWSNGPVPQNQLQNIQRVELKVTAASSKPDAKGQYAQTTLQSNVNAARSVPDFGAATFPVTGYVVKDLNLNHVKDSGEPGIANATVRMGPYVAYTSASGLYTLNVPSGAYQLQHTPAIGYGSHMTPDVFNVTITNNAHTQDFADTARAGGWVQTTVFGDLNGNGTWDTGETAASGIKVTISPGTPEQTQAYTSSAGTVSLFTGVGGFVVTCVAPDSMVVTTTPHPISGTMTNGASLTVGPIGIYRAYIGHITGKVFVDANRNGTLDGAETGISNVWVGATKDAGASVTAYAYSNATGDYDIQVPINDPPHTAPYAVYTIPPPGYFPTGTTSIGGQWVASGATVSGNNFGMANFQIITLTANRVLSLAAADVIEADWTGKKTNEARADADLLLGADAGATDNVSVWFNQYAKSPLFSTTPSHPDGYTRLAPNSVLSMAVDTLDQQDNKARPDLVTGTKYAVNGNFFVWFMQGSSNNEGYLSTSYSTGKNYLTYDNGDVQSVLTMDVGGGSMPDIIVGTKSPVAGQGSVEIWLNDDAAVPSFTRDEKFNSIYATILGEVNGMTLADIDNDGDRDLLVATRTSDYNGQMVIFDNIGRTAGARFVPRYAVSFGGLTPTTVSCLDADGDGWKDIFVGTQRSTSQGRIYQFRNTGAISGAYTFSIVRGIDAPGIVLSLVAADLGGSQGRTDLACGYRTSSVGYGGGVVIYNMDSGIIPFLGSDPSAGSIVNMVPAMATANFNYGVNTTAPPYPYLSDLAAGVKASPTTGALVVFIR